MALSRVSIGIVGSIETEQVVNDVEMDLVFIGHVFFDFLDQQTQSTTIGF